MPETEVSRQVGRPERWEDLPHFSYTQLSTYLTCPRRYFYRYVQRREPEDVAAALLFGKAVHLTVATYYEAVMRGETPPSGEELAELFRAEWREAVDSPVPVLYPKGETAACLEKQGMAAVKAFRLWAQPQRVLGVEEPFEVELVDGDGTPLERRLVGVFDLIEADEEGTPAVVDLKTAGRRASQEKAEHHLQAAVYAHALARLGKANLKEGVPVRFDVLVRGKDPGLQRFLLVKGEPDAQRVVGLLREVLRAVENQFFYRNAGWQCRECPFRRACEKDPH